MITYDRLWETMKKRGITQYHLIKREKFSAGQIGRLKNNMTVSTQTLDTLCRLLSCRIEDIVTYIPDNGETLPEQNPAVESISPCSTDTDANTDTGTDISKEKKVPSLYAKAKKGTKISKKSAKSRPGRQERFDLAFVVGSRFCRISDCLPDSGNCHLQNEAATLRIHLHLL